MNINEKMHNTPKHKTQKKETADIYVLQNAEEPKVKEKRIVWNKSKSNDDE